MGLLDRLRRRPAAPRPPLPEPLVEHVTDLVHPGFRTRADVLEVAGEHAAELGVDPRALVRLVDDVWRRRVAEQRSWPAVTDADRVAAAFDDLEREGVVARMDFACCTTCAVAEIGDEVPPGEVRHGFVYFHSQDAERLADPDARLMLGFGAFDAPDADAHERATVAVGAQVRAALERHGLAVVWDGSSGRRLEVPVDWRRRLPA